MQISRSHALLAGANPTPQRTAMSFDVDPRSHAVTVSVVDRRSGEVLQQMIYDKRVNTEPGKGRRAGSQIDLRA